MADFHRTFDLTLENGKWSYKQYKYWIADLRNKVSDPEEKKTHLSMPVLLPLNDSKPQFFDLILLTQIARPSEGIPSRGTRLRIRRDNLYLVGFTNANDTRDLYSKAHLDSLQWLEIPDEQGRQYIPGSKPLGFKTNYDSIERAARQTRDKIPLGKPQLTWAAETLANLTVVSYRDTARALLVVIQMICEAMRFKYIRMHISQETKRHAFEDVGTQPDTLCLELENMWAKAYSTAAERLGDLWRVKQYFGLLLRTDHFLLRDHYNAVNDK